VVVSGAVFATTKLVRHNPIPKSISDQVGFPLYYPARLPKGFTIDKSSFSYGNKVVAFVIRSGDKKIFVTEQTKPAGFDFDKFYLQKLDQETEFLTPIGKAASGVVNSNVRVVSLLTDQTWVFINTNTDVSFDQLEAITKGLARP
jgi:hypothetical protein